MKIGNIKLVLMLALMMNIARAQFGGGSGTWFDPYWISTPSHLNNIRTYEVDDEDTTWLYLNAAFVLVADIDLGVPPWNEDEGWEPIGVTAHPFTGYFNGNDHLIVNLTINRGFESNIGLFGVTSDADFYDVILANVMIDGGDNVGSLAGRFTNYSTMNEFDEVQTETSCSGEVNGNHHVGGLIGFADSSLIRLSGSTCSINGFDYVGGLVGRLDETDLRICFTNAVTVVGNNNYVGGLAGRAYESSIRDCYSAGVDVQMTGLGSITGGMVGYLYDNSEIIDSYCTGAVDGESHIGGLTGYNHGSAITNCYSLCVVTGSAPYLGGLAGRSDGTITNCYWDTDVSGIPGPGLGDGRTTDEMTYAYAENTYEVWDFENIWVQDPDIGFGQWNDGYPYLEWQHNPQQYGFAGGAGTEADPYLIGHPNHLNSVRGHLSAYFRQIADIDLGVSPWNEGNGWNPIGMFTGNYDGDDYIIENLTINNSNGDQYYLGLFETTQGAVISNVRLLNVNITGGTWESAGCLAGSSDETTISECYAEGMMSGGSNVGTTFYGGMVGYCQNLSEIIQCETEVDVSTLYFAGGMAGRLSNSTISHSCSKGNVEAGYDYAGGLVAYTHDGSTVQYCYSQGNIIGGNNFVGGVIGIQTESSAVFSYSMANVEGNWVGGFAGYVSNGSTISNSYSRGTVNGAGSGYEGGFVGYFPGGNISGCYSTGLVITGAPGRGFVGVGGGTVTDCFWDTETSGQENSWFGGTGKTTAEMKVLETFTDDSSPGLVTPWDFTADPFDDTAAGDCWDIDGILNNGYPFLSWQKPRVVWDGSMSPDPLIPDNWSTGSVPLSTDNILVPSDAGNNLAINNLPSEPLVLNSLFAEPGVSVNIQPGKALTLNGYIYNEGTLQILSDVTGSGSLINNESLPVTGNVSVWQYLSSESWHLVSPPIVDAVIEPYLDVYLKEFNEPDNSWTYLMNPLTIPMNPAHGYSAWASDALTGTTLVNFTGLINSGDYIISALSYTPASSASGWNLIGNPFPSSLQWNSAWAKTDVSDWMCVHNNGNDACFNSFTGTEWPNPGDLPEGIIPPTQGFWIRAGAADASITIPQSQRLHSSQGFYKKEADKTGSAIRLRVEGNNGYDVLLVQFFSEATAGYDPSFDLEKRWGYSSSPQIYAIIDSAQYFSVNVLPEIYNGLCIPVGFEAGAEEVYSLCVTEFSGIGDSLKVWLRDNKEGTLTGLSLSCNYVFDAEPCEPNHRFDLLFSSENMGSPSFEDNFRIYHSENKLIIENDLNLTGIVNIYDLAGRNISENILINGQRTIIPLAVSCSGYIVTVKTESGIISRKIIIGNF